MEAVAGFKFCLQLQTQPYTPELNSITNVNTHRPEYFGQMGATLPQSFQLINLPQFSAPYFFQQAIPCLVQ